MPFSGLENAAISAEYGRKNIPSNIDNKIINILDDCLFEYKSKSSVRFGDARVLNLFAERMASLAVREDNIKAVKHGLIALTVCAQNEDIRDVLVVLSILHDAALKIEGTAERIFREMRSITYGSEFLDDYLNRADKDKIIESMGYEESRDDNGFLYLRIC